MLGADPPPTLEALTTLCSSVLHWNERLNELNGQIALRQVELARLEEHRSPPTRSLRNKGSTESLRPRDGQAQEDIAEDNAEGSLEGLALQSSSPPKASRRNQKSGQRSGSGTPAKAAAQTGAFSSPPIPLTATPKKAPSLKGRPTPHTSSSSPAPVRPGPAKLQKRKTESLASGESAAPKYRTRSMIIVYYDSAVQSAFEELVKFVSGSRNTMRKGKMAARMAEMRRAAEREIEADAESDGDDQSFPQLSSAALRNSRARAARNNGIPNTGSDPKHPEGTGVRADLLRDAVPRYTNPRGSGIQTDGLRSMLSASVIKRSADGEQDIFETIDKALEWCQSQCEFAAHKFLREGECGTEIENIKNKLSEVRTCAQKEIDRLEAEDASALPKIQSSRQVPEDGKARDQKHVHMRRSAAKPKGLEEDSGPSNNMMEVDDEGFEDMDISQLVFKRSRDIAR